MADIDKNKIYLETERFLEENADRYRELVELVKRYLNERLRDCDQNAEAVSKIYSRSDQSQRKIELKNPQSVAEKLIRFKQQEPLEWATKKAIDIHDIVACRVVVFYKYQVGLCLERIKDTINRDRFKISYSEYKDQYGYHAHHVVLSALRPNHLKKLLCEVQIKTVLHDAWGGRTHSFIYKPSGKVSSSIRLLMEGIGDSLETIERQTDHLRQSFNRERDIEKKLRSAARIAMLYRLATKVFQSEELTTLYSGAYKYITENSNYIATSSRDDDIINEILNKIDFIKDFDGGLEAAFNLMLLLCSIKEQNDLNYLCIDYLEQFLDFINKGEVDRLFWTTSVLYVIGEREMAIVRLREHARSNLSDFSNQVYWTTMFNLLNYIIESVMQGVSNPAMVHCECDTLIENLGLKTLKPEHERFCSVQDTLGAYWIAFGSSESEIEKGILLCRNAYNGNTTDEAGVAFQRLHERIGWTKILKSDPI